MTQWYVALVTSNVEGATLSRLRSSNRTNQEEHLAENACPFCSLPPARILHCGPNAVVIRDGFPISPGHTLVIPRRHVGSFFQLTADERMEMLALLDQAKADLVNEFKPDGYNIGINDGAAAGQTVPHLHIHLIPRFRNDQDDPRGGVRWIIPGKADYWSPR
jgi:diadenosine tetraphosphate (Ap4A) HIT family hydrolase